MALTPEDVVNKRFNPTKFREGYDQDEVDDFLDEVVVELRRLNAENEELRQRLVAADARMQELQRALQQAPQAAVAAAPAPAQAAAAPQYQAPTEPVDPSLDPSNTNNLLQLARRLHEEHVREGMEKRDSLIAEGHAAAAKIVSDAQDNQRAALAGLEQEKQNLEQEKAQIEQRIDDLRNFEREYRMKLKEYIEGQLQELDSSAPASLEPAAAGAVANAGYGYDAATQAYDYRNPQQYDYGQQQPGYPQQQPANYGYPQPTADYSGYQQPTEYPGFAGGN